MSEKKRKRKTYKNPNGYGSISLLGGRRRRPYIVKVNTRYDEKGKQIYDILGYYETRQDAMIALAEYNKNPYDIDTKKITFKEVYEGWSKRKFNEMKNGKLPSKSSVSSYQAAFKHCSIIHDSVFSDLTTLQLQNVINNCNKGRATLENINILLNQLYKYAIEFDIVSKDWSKFTILTKQDTKSKRSVFTKDEIKSLWRMVGDPIADSVLILLYTGMRIQEFLTLKSDNIYFKDGYIRCGIKTSAGIDRIIPIHSSIFDLLEKIEFNTETYSSITYDRYKKKFNELMSRINAKHTPHDTRHTFISLLDSAGGNETCIKKIVGHSLSGVTKQVYTHKELSELKETIELLESYKIQVVCNTFATNLV